ncbi:MAG: ABC transporter [Planctomycetaceae bacterium]
MLVTVSHDFLPKQNSTRAAIVMDHFGIGFEQGRHVIAEELDLSIQTGDVVLFTGASGSGKSSLMRAAASQLQQADSSPLNIDALNLGDRILIDRLPLSVTESMQLLSACGLGEAHLLLRTPAELSDGQRYRFRLACGLALKPAWIVADEFTATLDRTLARVIAFNIRRLAGRTGTGFLLATTHEDIAEDLSPDIHVQCRLDGEIDIVRNDESADSLKKKRSPSLAICGSARRPSPTGRILLGGIIGATTSGSRGL